MNYTIKQTEKNNRFQKNKDLQDNIKRSNIHMTGGPGEKKQNRNKRVFEKIMAEVLPEGLAKDISLSIKELSKHRQTDPKKSKVRHIIIKLLRINNKYILKANREIVPIGETNSNSKGFLI